MGKILLLFKNIKSEGEDDEHQRTFRGNLHLRRRHGRRHEVQRRVRMEEHEQLRRSASGALLAEGHAGRREVSSLGPARRRYVQDGRRA